MTECSMSVLINATARRGRIPTLPRRGQVSWFEIVLLLVCVAAVASSAAQSMLDVIVLSFLFAGLALAWNIAGGYAGLISFGHSAFFGVGAFTSTILLTRYGLSPWIGIWVGAVIAASFGSILAIICARL